MSRQQSQRVAIWAITAVAILVILPIVVVILFVIINGLSAMSWEFLSQPPRNGMREGGVFPAILGTILLTLGTAVAAIPLGIGAAIYLAEYAPDNRFTLCNSGSNRSIDSPSCWMTQSDARFYGLSYRNSRRFRQRIV
jgi:phosphate transport system permease protein